MPITGVESALHEMKKGSKHIRTREQAIAVGLKAKRERNPPFARQYPPRRGSSRRFGRS